MQILMPVYNVDSKNIFFSEKRKNVILDGNFVKIIYSTEHFEMTGLQILLRLQSLQRKNDASGLTEVPILNDASICRRRTEDLINREFAESRGLTESLGGGLRKSENGSGAFKLNLPAYLLSGRSPVAQDVKFIETFDPYSAANSRQIELLCNIEYDIVNNYIQLHAPQKNAVYNLKSQLTSRTFRFTCATPGNHLSPNEHYLLKISGIWETNMNVGITVKFVRL
jgi:hypothetical protein